MDTRWTSSATSRFIPTNIPSVPVSWLYRIGLLGVALSLILLQLIYLGMIALAAILTILYILAIPQTLQNLHFNAVTIVLIATPVVTGAIVTFFLFKPLLSRPPKPQEPRFLDPDTEPLLYEFVQRICWAVGSRAPSRIFVDTQVNAAASLHRGWRGFFTGDLTLTIGLPLAGGLTLRQFSGVLAHEFGHFSQRVGMRLHFLIGMIRLWFTRVAYERDDWDVQLDQMRADAGWRMKIVLGIASAAVSASRAILRGLLRVATWISAWFSRQMEFDADRYEAALVGATVFEQTTDRLAVLQPVAHATWNLIDEAWKMHKLPEDFPYLVAHRDQLLQPELRQSLVESARAATMEQDATHPPAAARIANVQGIKGIVPEPDSTEQSADPVLRDDLRAGILFADFGALCREITRAHYGRILEGELSKAIWIQSQAFAGEIELDFARKDAIATFFGPLTMPSRWFQLPSASAPDEPAKSVELHISAGIDEGQEYWKLLEKTIARNAGLRFLQNDRGIEPVSFHLSSRTLEGATIETEQARDALTQEIARLRERYAPQGLVFNAYCEADDRELLADYRSFGAMQDQLLDLRLEAAALDALRNNIEIFDFSEAQRITGAARAVLQNLTAGILEALGKKLQDPLLEGVPEDTRQDPELLARQILLRADILGEQLLGDICAAAVSALPPSEPVDQ